MAKMTDEQKRKQRQRNWIIAAIIVTFIAIIYVVSVIQIGFS